MRTRILSEAAGRRTLWHEHADGSVTIQQRTDVTACVERAKALHREGLDTTGMGDKHVASIPVAVLDAWARRRGKTFAHVMADDAMMREFLDDAENSVFRVWRGAL